MAPRLGSGRTLLGVRLVRGGSNCGPDADMYLPTLNGAGMPVSFGAPTPSTSVVREFALNGGVRNEHRMTTSRIYGIVAQAHEPDLLPKVLQNAAYGATELRAFTPLDPTVFLQATTSDQSPDTEEIIMARVNPGQLERRPLTISSIDCGFDALREASGEEIVLRRLVLQGTHFYIGRGTQSGAFYWYTPDPVTPEVDK